MKFNHIKSQVYMSVLESKNNDELVEIMIQHLDEVYSKAEAWDRHVEYFYVQDVDDIEEDK